MQTYVHMQAHGSVLIQQLGKHMCFHRTMMAHSRYTNVYANMCIRPFHRLASDREGVETGVTVPQCGREVTGQACDQVFQAAPWQFWDITGM